MFFGGNFGIDVRHQRRLAEQADRLEVLDRVVRQRGLQRRVGREVAYRDEQGVAVGRGLCSGGGSDHGGGARPRLHDHLLAPVLQHLLAEHAGEDVGRAARRERHDDFDRPLRIFVGGLRDGLGGGERRDGGQTYGAQSARNSHSHDALPWPCGPVCGLARWTKVYRGQRRANSRSECRKAVVAPDRARQFN